MDPPAIFNLSISETTLHLFCKFEGSPRNICIFSNFPNVCIMDEWNLFADELGGLESCNSAKYMLIRVDVYTFVFFYVCKVLTRKLLASQTRHKTFNAHLPESMAANNQSAKTRRKYNVGISLCHFARKNLHNAFCSGADFMIRKIRSVERWDVYALTVFYLFV